MAIEQKTDTPIFIGTEFYRAGEMKCSFQKNLLFPNFFSKIWATVRKSVLIVTVSIVFVDNKSVTRSFKAKVCGTPATLYHNLIP